MNQHGRGDGLGAVKNNNYFNKLAKLKNLVSSISGELEGVPFVPLKCYYILNNGTLVLSPFLFF
jgi:hypothetical protein